MFLIFSKKKKKKNGGALRFRIILWLTKLGLAQFIWASTHGLLNAILSITLKRKSRKFITNEFEIRVINIDPINLEM